jgi:ABC-2 type transport system ATP-binding protein
MRARGDGARASGLPSLALSEVTRGYRRRSVLDAVSLTVEPGEAVGLIGPNGSGKTTLLRLAAGLLRPAAGIVAVGGLTPRQAGARGWLAYFAGGQTLPPAMPPQLWARLVAGRPLPEAAAGRIRTLSRGSRQLLGLRAALAPAQTRLLLLDEPWESLDPDASRWLGEQVNAVTARGAGALLSSHRMHDLAGLCQRYAVLAAGRVVVAAAAQLAPGRVVTGADLFAFYDRARAAAEVAGSPVPITAGRGTRERRGH